MFVLNFYNTRWTSKNAYSSLILYDVQGTLEVEIFNKMFMKSEKTQKIAYNYKLDGTYVLNYSRAIKIFYIYTSRKYKLCNLKIHGYFFFNFVRALTLPLRYFIWVPVFEHIKLLNICKYFSRTRFYARRQ